MTNDPPIAEQWHAALDGRERSEAPVYVPPERRPPPADGRREGVLFRLSTTPSLFSRPGAALHSSLAWECSTKRRGWKIGEEAESK
jgi:hypothetical protein